MHEILKHGLHTQGKLLREHELQRNTAEMIKFICYSKRQHCVQDSVEPLLISRFYLDTLLLAKDNVTIKPDSGHRI